MKFNSPPPIPAFSVDTSYFLLFFSSSSFRLLIYSFLHSVFSLSYLFVVVMVLILFFVFFIISYCVCVFPYFSFITFSLWFSSIIHSSNSFIVFYISFWPAFHFFLLFFCINLLFYTFFSGTSSCYSRSLTTEFEPHWVPSCKILQRVMIGWGMSENRYIR